MNVHQPLRPPPSPGMWDSCLSSVHFREQKALSLFVKEMLDIGAEVGEGLLTDPEIAQQAATYSSMYRASPESKLHSALEAYLL